MDPVRSPAPEESGVHPSAPAVLIDAPGRRLDASGRGGAGFPRRRLSIGTIFVTVFVVVLALAMFAAIYRPFALVLALGAAVVALAWFRERRGPHRP
jgi:Flp pilus assembly protein TadB